MSSKTKITVAYGDGIGPEIMSATLKILEAAGARIEAEVIEIGEKVYLKGITSGIEESSWESLSRTKVFLKAPITTPQGGGFKSLNVTTRKTLGLYANVRPCRSFHPFVKTNHPKTDLVIVRENEEDLYAGIEYRQTQEVTEALKLVSRPGSEKIIRYAFEYARKYGRKKVTCMSKDNIMKISDGLFHQIFNEVALEYPEIETNHVIIDIGSALIADRPEMFDVIVTLNLYGDIISDIAAQITGSVGLGGSANVGNDVAMFEAIHGSAPDIAGKGIANPSGLLNAAIMMLVHIGQPDIAEKVSNAWMKTIEDGVHTGDIYKDDLSKVRATTASFADAIIERLGQKPATMVAAKFESEVKEEVKALKVRPHEKKEFVGVDVFLDWSEDDRNPNVLGEKMRNVSGDGLTLNMINNRGVKVYPGGKPETFCSDNWRCRFNATAETCTHQQVIKLLERITNAGLEFVKVEHLYTFNGVRGYSLGQGE